MKKKIYFTCLKDEKNLFLFFILGGGGGCLCLPKGELTSIW
jgi:hypothetical protein